jgi:uncharacterized protein YndB with AHSA1/START domain
MPTPIAVEFEYLIRSSPKILYNFIRTSNGMGDWFADAVKEDKNVFSFTWDTYTERARLIDARENESVSFCWIDGEREGLNFSMKVKVDDITGDVALIVSDEVYDVSETDELKRLWDASIAQLMKTLGS